MECLLLDQVDAERWHALVHPGQKLKPGARMVFTDDARAPGLILHGEVLERRYFGRRLVRLRAEGVPTAEEAIDRLGHVPLPPYIHRPDTDEDRERYQTVYARVRGSVAAPTAGLHFDETLLRALAAAGVNQATLTHHVGYGTFQPVRVEHVEEHCVQAETCEIPANAAEAIAETRRRAGRVIAVGTTSVRALESAADSAGAVRPGSRSTDLFIFPGYRFRVIDGLLTNFHLPRSSLLMLVAAFAGRELILDAYRDAIARGFRFYSYGDAMLIV